ncbi:MAG: hypothetical protein AAFQ74_14440 [Cyanobacteria bacterium J06623_4]
MTWFQAREVKYKALINSVLRRYMKTDGNQQAH